MVRLSSKSVGDGITVRSVQETSYDLANLDDRALLKRHIDAAYDRLNGPWARHDRMIAGFRKLWDHFETELPSDPVARASRLKVRSSEEWYVLQIVRYAKLVERYVEERPWEALSLACEIGQLATEYSFKFSIEEAALLGGKLVEGRRRANRRAIGQSAQERVDFAKQLQVEGSRVRASLHGAAAHFGISYSMMSKDYYAQKAVPPLVE